MKERSRPVFRLKVLMLGVVLLGGGFAKVAERAAAQTVREVNFNRDIRPIFSGACFRCHGPDKGARKAGLRLDLREEATKRARSGAIPIVPGRPEESEIVRRIFSTEKGVVMPPEEAHKILTAEQKALVRRWVAEGAKYEGHWAYQPLRRPAIPTVSTTGAAPRRNPIDDFIQARLEKEGLTSSPEADRRTLIRRVSLDLTGIPPTPQEVARFVADASPDAYEKLVDRLLASPRHAEKQAMHWLDAVRYADTAGFHGDNAFPAWPYRDYVLRAFRDNKPFDEFTREQLAGDLLPNATIEQRVASAYNRLNRVSAEGGVQPKEYLAKYAADRVRTTSTVWLGATMGCAECHDHKFDPFLTRDFYSMKAFFADIRESGLVPDRGRNAWGSKMAIPTEEQKRGLDRLNRQLGYLDTEMAERGRALAEQRAAWERRTLADFEAGRLAWQLQRPMTAMAANGTSLRIYNDEKLTVAPYRGGNLITEEITGDGLVVAGGANPDNETYTITFKPGAGEWTALGVQAVQDESLPADRFARGSDRFVLTEVEAEVASGGGGRPQRLAFVLATTDGFGQQIENPAMAAIDGDPKTGWGISFGDGRDGFLALRLAQTVRTEAGSVVTVRLRHDSAWRRAVMGRFRLALSAGAHSWPDHLVKLPRPLKGLPADLATALREPEEKRTESQRKAISDHFRWASPELQPLVVRAARLEAERDLLDAQVARVMVVETIPPRETRILPRGNFLDESGEIVQPAVPMAFGALDLGDRRGTRLDLANWIVSRDNPLTARVFANRQWRLFFGAGLSRVLDDLGSQGEAPRHPELLDWLASEFIHPTVGLSAASTAHDWDVRHLVRLIVTSHAYRQTSVGDSRLEEKDPDNRLLARQSRFRVDAELVRDIALSVSGLLAEQFGGPSVKPYQPEGYLGALNFPVRDYSHDHDAALYRRGMYVHWQRTFLHPSLMTFDAPSREECTVNRVNSNTPLQALVLLNDPIFVEAARAFAQNALKQGGPAVESQIAWAFERATGRRPLPQERRVLVSLHAQSLARFQKKPDAARELLRIGDAPPLAGASPARLASMIAVTRAILNLHETITRN
ncbi:MAG: PSD1 and planctomycete cytochrome C domain-containing protein [Blastocatellia bacterium]|nr:PSD1 and planctomycete cytochrome C domain-containing protein [Blastocatellia bacterium]